MKVFLSYSRSDDAVALPLTHDLRGAGMEVCVDPFDTPVGGARQAEVERALRECTHFIVLMSPAAVATPAVMDGVSFALDAHKSVVPLLLHDCDWPERMRHLPDFDFRSGRDALGELLARLGPTAPSAASDRAVASLKLGPLRALEANHPVLAIAFSPDGRLLASAGGVTGLGLDGHFTVRLWSLADGQPVRTCAPHRDDVRSLAFSPDGTLLASSGSQATRVWRVADGSLLRSIDGPASAPADDASSPSPTLQFATDGQRLLVGTTVWNTATGAALGTVAGLSTACSAYALAPDGSTAAISAPSALTVRRLRSGKTLAHWHASDLESLWALAFSPSGRWLAMSAQFKSRGGGVLLWHLGADGAPPVTLAGGDTRHARLAFSPDERWLAFAVGPKLQCFCTADGLLADRAVLAPGAGFGLNGVHSVAFSPDGHWLGVACEDKTLRLWATEATTG